MGKIAIAITAVVLMFIILVVIFIKHDRQYPAVKEIHINGTL